MAYAKNYLAVHFKLDYVNADGDISNYYPDFVVKVSDKKTFIIETKGLEDLDVPLKMRRLRHWCEDINRAQTDVAYDCIYVDEDSFEQYKPIMAMADRTDVEVLDASRECFSRNGGDGGESNSPSKRPPSRICYKLVRRFDFRLWELPPAQYPRG